MYNPLVKKLVHFWYDIFYVYLKNDTAFLVIRIIYNIDPKCDVQSR